MTWERSGQLVVITLPYQYFISTTDNITISNQNLLNSRAVANEQLHKLNEGTEIAEPLHMYMN